jgi:uncharacterized protein YcbX
MLKVSQLFIYPIKSMAGIALKAAKITDRGLEYDRRWMLIDQNNRFISQREYPQMALLQPALTPGGLSITHLPTGAQILVPYLPASAEFIAVTVWDDTCTGQYVNDEAAAWFSDILGAPCRLVYMPDDSHRMVEPEYTDGNKLTSFSDAYPFLAISQASLDDVSLRSGETIPADRFRPNIVFTGGQPFMEDEMAHFTINNINFYGAKLCARCPIPGINQQTAQRVKEPLKALNTYRRMRNKVWMGQNLVHEGEGGINVGDAIEVLEVKEAAVFDISTL